jgi:hypothetical protein
MVRAQSSARAAVGERLFSGSLHSRVCCGANGQLDGRGALDVHAAVDAGAKRNSMRNVNNFFLRKGAQVRGLSFQCFGRVSGATSSQQSSSFGTCVLLELES